MVLVYESTKMRESYRLAALFFSCHEEPNEFSLFTIPYRMTIAFLVFHYVNERVFCELKVPAAVEMSALLHTNKIM